MVLTGDKACESLYEPTDKKKKFILKCFLSKACLFMFEAKLASTTVLASICTPVI